MQFGEADWTTQALRNRPSYCADLGFYKTGSCDAQCWCCSLTLSASSARFRNACFVSSVLGALTALRALDNRRFHGNAFTLLGSTERFLSDALPMPAPIAPDRFEKLDEPLYPPLATRV